MCGAFWWHFTYSRPLEEEEETWNSRRGAAVSRFTASAFTALLDFKRKSPFLTGQGSTSCPHMKKTVSGMKGRVRNTSWPLWVHSGTFSACTELRQTRCKGEKPRRDWGSSPKCWSKLVFCLCRWWNNGAHVINLSHYERLLLEMEGGGWGNRRAETLLPPTARTVRHDGVNPAALTSPCLFWEECVRVDEANPIFCASAEWLRKEKKKTEQNSNKKKTRLQWILQMQLAATRLSALIVRACHCILMAQSN